MDTDIICWAYKFQSLVDGKHQFGRAINALTKQLIQQIIGQSTPPARELYTPSKEAFQADLLNFRNALFRQLSKPPAPPHPPSADDIAAAVAKAIKPPLPVETAITKAVNIAVTNAVNTAVKSQTTTLNSIASFTKNINKNIVNISR